MNRAVPSHDRLAFPEPTEPAGSREEVLLRYLDFFRDVVVAKLEGLGEDQLRSSSLPSGWAPLEMLKHLVFMERRWLVWGFAGEDVADPWGDDRDGRWHVGADESLADLVEQLRAGGVRTRAVAQAHALGDPGRPGPRWGDAEPATLERVLLHVLQEYARHVGHLDIVRELADGTVGE
ncbi:MAG: DinB family protein [Nocardioidaceae bacterium]